ncbi:Bax inhibitor-1/YccA family protein [Agrococcus jejuensis]|uniref:Bax inhibitor-1/YccA family protein n=1 Tax=Agrococcus jejuensis TaxID=399736 RepID=UPI001642694D|nr:Bax inhibitor-1/YccA family protein [Agrococcus jejuensis]
MAGFGFSNSPAFSRDPKRAAQLQQDGAYVPGQTYAPQQGQGQQPSQQQGFQQHGQPAPGFQPGAATPEQLGRMYDRPSATSADTGRLTYDGVIMKTVAMLAIVATGFLLQMALLLTGNGMIMQGLMWVGLIAGLVLGLVNAFKREPNRALILGYAAAQGLAIGGFSAIIEFGMGYDGIVFQALLATACVFAATLALYAFRIVRVTPKFTRFFFIVLIGYGLFSLVNFGLMVTGISPDPWGLRSVEVPILGLPFGVVLGALAVLLGAYSLMLDFNNVEIGVQRGVPAKYGWQAAFGITATIIWLYVEILRILAILRGNN